MRGRGGHDPEYDYSAQDRIRCTVGVVASLRAFSAEPVNIEANLAELKSADMDARRDAITALQTSDDLRIPQAPAWRCYRTRATRRVVWLCEQLAAVMRRFPAAEVPEFLRSIAAARPGAEGRGYLSMLERAEGLLARKYDSEMFAPSPDGKYVVYERRGLACVLDAQTGKDTLVGKRDDFFLLFSAVAREWPGPATRALECCKQRRRSGDDLQSPQGRAMGLRSRERSGDGARGEDVRERVGHSRRRGVEPLVCASSGSRLTKSSWRPRHSSLPRWAVLGKAPRNQSSWRLI